jgi:TonB family protein
MRPPSTSVFRFNVPSCFSQMLIKQTFSQPSPAPNKPKVDGPPDTGTKPDASHDETESGCHVSTKLRREGEIRPDFGKRVRDALADKVCDLVVWNFNVAAASISFKMTFEIRKDGSVANSSIQRSSGSPQFDDEVKKTVQEARFPEIAGTYETGAPVQVTLEMSYSRKSNSQVPLGK